MSSSLPFVRQEREKQEQRRQQEEEEKKQEELAAREKAANEEKQRMQSAAVTVCGAGALGANITESLARWFPDQVETHLNSTTS